MFNGDFTIRDWELGEDPVALAKLGPEARSILKSIQTEDSKLMSAASPTRSDVHYFRARFNYYRLSLLRLLPEEKSTLEPTLSKFLGHIVKFEMEGGSADQPAVTPFLTSVAREPRGFAAPAPTVASASPAGGQNQRPTDAVAPLNSAQDVISQLTLIKMALASDIDHSARKILAEGLDRVIVRLKNS